jgi:Ig-like domain CHU_C associated
MKKSLTAIRRHAKILFPKLGTLMLLFQRAPLVKLILPESQVISATGMGQVLKWTVATVAGLGAFDSVAGATVISQLAPNAGSTKVNATTGTRMSFVFQVTGAPSSTKSWQVIGKLPPGLTHTNAAGKNVDSIVGTPTRAGSYPITIKAWEESGFRGGSVSKTFTMVVAQGTKIPPAITVPPASVVIQSGKRARLSVAASGEALTYQWFKGKSGDTKRPIQKATLPVYKTPPLAVTSNYWVRITNPAGSVDSATVTLTVTGAVLSPFLP